MLSAARFLQAQGHCVRTVFVYSNKRLARSIDKFAGVPVDKTPWSDQGLRTMRSIIESGFDLIHAFSESHPFVLEATSGIATGSHIIINVGHSRATSKADEGYYRDQRVKRLVCVCRTIADGLSREMPDVATKLAVCYGGVDTRKFAPRQPDGELMNELSLQGRTVIGLVASARRYKGLQYFISAAARILERHRTYAFVIVGHTDGWIHRELKALIREKEQRHGIQLSEAVRFTGPRSDVDRFMSLFDVCVSSSTSYEGISGSIREAMAMRIPVVCTDVGGNRELVIDGETGFLVEPRDSDGLAERVVYAAENRTQVDRMVNNAHALIVDRFRDSDRCERLTKIYEEVLDGQ